MTCLLAIHSIFGNTFFSWQYYFYLYFQLKQFMILLTAKFPLDVFSMTH